MIYKISDTFKVMHEAIIDKANKSFIHTEEFTKDAVNAYLKDPKNFSKHPLRHYNQLKTNFDQNLIKESLIKLNIPNQDITVTVFGGYTGQFADCLRKIGLNVIFTDPINDWVKQAIKNGLESYNYSADEIPGDIIRKTDLFATFECYFGLFSETTIYTTMRFLSAKYGILFGESNKTRDELDEEAGTPLRRIKFSMLPFKKTYSIKRVSREKGEVRLYHFYAEKDGLEKMSLDCKVMYQIYQKFPDSTKLDEKDVSFLSETIGVSEENIINSIFRILKLYLDHIPQNFKIYFPLDKFRLFSKSFITDIE